MAETVGIVVIYALKSSLADSGTWSGLRIITYIVHVSIGQGVSPIDQFTEVGHT